MKMMKEKDNWDTQKEKGDDDDDDDDDGVDMEDEGRKEEQLGWTTTIIGTAVATRTVTTNWWV